MSVDLEVQRLNDTICLFMNFLIVICIKRNKQDLEEILEFRLILKWERITLPKDLSSPSFYCTVFITTTSLPPPFSSCASFLLGTGVFKQRHSFAIHKFSHSQCI